MNQRDPCRPPGFSPEPHSTRLPIRGELCSAPEPARQGKTAGTETATLGTFRNKSLKSRKLRTGGCNHSAQSKGSDVTQHLCHRRSLDGHGEVCHTCKMPAALTHRDLHRSERGMFISRLRSQNSGRET